MESFASCVIIFNLFAMNQFLRKINAVDINDNFLSL